MVGNMSDTSKRTRAAALALVAGLTLAACDRGKEPSGQVVATVDGQEVTIRELRAELGNLSFATPAERKAGEQAALQAIVNRKLLAKASEDQKLDKSPEFALQKQ